VGFLPGFAYLASVDPRLVVGRRAVPRPRVEAGSIGIAGQHTGIYPLASPGGWRIIGRVVHTRLFDAAREPPALFAPGDRVCFLSRDSGAASRA
jgi:KipI family sensor histidine kinase inhibitor